MKAYKIFLVPRNTVIFLLISYRRFISPLYGDVCRYHPTCSAYTLGSVQQHGAFVGLVLGAWRLFRCHPWAKGGIDDVRRKNNFRYFVTTSGFVRSTALGKV